MAHDPFADDTPWDTGPESDPLTDQFTYDPEPTDDEETDDMADYVTPEPTNTEVSVTLKGGAGYDAPWVVLRGPDVDTVAAMLDEKLQNLLGQTAKYGASFSRQAAPARPAASQGSQQQAARQQAPANRAPAGAQEHPEGKREFCEHGEMIYKSGIAGPRAKNPGKPYSMFTCPHPVREEQCRPKNA